MAAASLLLLLVGAAVHNVLSIEVNSKLDVWDELEPDVDENEVEAGPQGLTIVDVRVVVPNGSAATTAVTHADVPVYVPVPLVTAKPSVSRPWKHHGSYAPTSTVGVPDVPVYVPVSNTVSSGSDHHKTHYEDVPVIIGTTGVKQVQTDGSHKTVPVVVPISINVSTGKEPKTPKHSDVPVIIGTGSGKATTSTVPPDVPVVYGLNLGPQFDRHGGAGFVRRPPPELADRTFWLPPVVALAPRPWLPPVLLPPPRYPQPQPQQPQTRPPTVAPTRRTTTTTASTLQVDDKLDFDEA